MDVTRAVRSLRAVRAYDGTPISDEAILRWLDAARWTGSSKNSQPWHAIVVRDRALLHDLKGRGEWADHLDGAEAAVVLLGRSDDFPDIFDLGGFAQSLRLCAHADGVGSCIAVFEPEENVHYVNLTLGVPDGWVQRMAIGFGHGHPGRREPDWPSPPGRRPLDEVVSWGTFGGVLPAVGP